MHPTQAPGQNHQPAPTVSPTAPNIVLFLADDLGYGDLTAYGNRYTRTPRINQLAAEGTTFDRVYVNGVTCVPSRVAYLTGRFPSRFSPVSRYIKHVGFDRRQDTLTSILHDKGDSGRGYLTLHSGKWHIGPDEEDGVYGIDRVVSDSSAWAGDESNVPGHRVDRPKDYVLVTNAIEMLEDSMNVDKPFYLQVWSTMTHHPIFPPAHLVQNYRSTEFDRGLLSASVNEKLERCAAVMDDSEDGLRQYLAEVEGMDQGVGRILDTLERLGIQDNTIFIFTSDHGAAPIRVDRTARNRCSLMGCAGRFDGGKHDLSEGGVRVPMIVRWPRFVPAGVVNTATSFAFVDFLPTLATLAEVPAQELPGNLDGINMVEVWYGNATMRYRGNNDVIWFKPTALSVLRDNFKYVNDDGGQTRLLFDVDADPTEQHNLYGDRDYRSIRNALKRVACDYIGNIDAEWGYQTPTRTAADFIATLRAAC